MIFSSANLRAKNEGKASERFIFALEILSRGCYNDAIKSQHETRAERKEPMTDSERKTRKERALENERTEETRTRIKEKLYTARAAGQMDEDDEALILEYALGVVTRRGKPTRD